ncbi:PREDICTED: putative F-box/kelch-repeat protein At2g29800 [Camelina sativa]|uniref:F-box/kelch-repeat protein At2g29800 n=1 Tax=Camelina sativa TaxID=90675 RepID=A0ABM0WP45_CAMSA|nr:PREDICTED: putative F-box/kelch-repeat protein At2g29800 [Camelina sativa]
MALISETSDDGSNGGDPTKNPQEEEEEANQDKEPKEEDNQEVDQNLAPIRRRDIPLILIESTVALIRRCHYPRLSLLSRAFRDVISSDQLLVTRSLLGLTEPVLYTLITFPSFEPPSWYILHRSNMSLRLSRIISLPPMYPGCTAITIGHKIYVMGGRNGLNQRVKAVIVIDCRFHTWKHIQNMKRERCYAASGVIDGKIYVVGGRERRYNDWVEVFDVETETWETVPGPFSPVASSYGVFPIHVVLDNKIYILDHHYCLAYDPRLLRWSSWATGSPQRLFWHASSCVVDDLLYAIVPDVAAVGSPIVVYDPKDMVWRPVKGLDDMPSLGYFFSRMASFGGKLVILGWCQIQDSCDHDTEKNVLCVEVALEKRQDGAIWGKVESTSPVESLISPVHSSVESPFFLISRTVTF